MSTTTHKRAIVAALSRHRSPDDPELLDAQREMATESIAEYIAAKIASTPPLTDEQIARLRGLLPPPAGRRG